jgi:hypothetical protein
VIGLAYTKMNSHMCTSYTILGSHLSIRLRSSKRKTYNTRVVRNGEANLLFKRDFKRLSVCDEFGKICLKLKT